VLADLERRRPKAEKRQVKPDLAQALQLNGHVRQPDQLITVDRLATRAEKRLRRQSQSGAIAQSAD
jgi:hypothetical protein